MGSETGKPQLELGASQDGTRLWLYDRAGAKRWFADASAEGSSLLLSGSDGTARAGMMVTDGGGDVAIYDAQGKTVSSIKHPH